MQEAYKSSATMKDNDDDDDAEDSVTEDPRPTEFEVLNLLDEKHRELNRAETDDTVNEFMDMEIEVAADSGASEHVAADTDAPTYKI